MLDEYDSALDRLEDLVQRLENALHYGRGIRPRRRGSQVDSAEAELAELFRAGARVWWPSTRDGPLSRYSQSCLLRARTRLRNAGLIRKTRLGGSRDVPGRWVWQLATAEDE